MEAEGDVLVMAGAGTGKTHTLVERVLHFALRPENPVAIDRFLVVTFTEAATAELQRRLADALTERHEAAPDDAWVTAQLARLDQAMIGTLHGYCLRLLREHFHALGLDPAVHTLDEGEARVLQEQVLASLWDPAYAGTDPSHVAIRALWETHFQGQPRDAGDALRDLHAAVRALEDPEGWWRRQVAYWESPTPTAWRDDLLSALTPWAADWLGRLGGARDNPAAAANPHLARRLPGLEALSTLVPGEAGATDRVARILDTLREQPDEGWPRGRKTALREPLKALFEEATSWTSWLTPGPGGTDPLQQDWDACRGHMRTLLELLHRFQEDYARRKRELSAVDFADQEHFALDLLGRGADVGMGPVAEGERDRFDCLLIDECQDLNAAQDAILRAISRPAGNRFLVGDVKQAIYRFRQADPAIFQHYARRWSAPGAPGRVLTLNENFRSAAGVLDFVNGLFPWVLRPEVGGVAFGPDAALQFGDPAGRAPLAGATPRVEVHLEVARSRNPAAADEGSDDDAPGEDGDAAVQAATRVALRLRELKEGRLQVWDKRLQGLRDVDWGDMAVLLRGKRSRVADFTKAFAAHGIPLQAGAGGYFERPEIRDLRNLVALLDNPLQDVPLVGVLRSAFGGVTEADQLAAIRLVRRRGPRPPGEPPERWWTLLHHFVEVGRPQLGTPVRADAPAPVDAAGQPALSGADVFTHPATAAAARDAWTRVELFLRRFADWRRRASRGPLSLALEAALDDTGFEAACRQATDGDAVNANVQRFLGLARQFDQRPHGTAAAFLQWLSGLSDAESVPAAVAGGAAAVTMLTIHKSKGLEFPVVAVASLDARFNQSDWTAAEWILDARHNLAPRIRPPEGRPYPSPTLWLAQRHQRREQWGEELRLLYVALTRAVDRLLLFGKVSPNRLTQWQERPSTPQAPLPVVDIESASSCLDWLGPALAAWDGVDWSRESGSTTHLEWRLWTDPPPAKVVATGTASNDTAPDPAPSPSPRPPYPHPAATREPAKATVTGLRKRRQLELDEESGRLTFTSNQRRRTLTDAEESAPADASTPMDVSAVERGLLHHRFMEHVDVARTGSMTELSAELGRLVEAGRFTPAEAAALDVPAIHRFWSGPLGEAIRRHPEDVRRELPFTLRLSMSDLRQLGFHPDPDLAPEEFVVVQGVIDLACLRADGAWLLDFKTDRLPAHRAVDEKAAGYAPQLALYALAVERLFGRPVVAGWLHFLATGAEVDVLARRP